MPDFGSTVLLRTPLGISLSAIRQLFPSIAITSRRSSSRGDANLQQAEVYLRVTEEQLNAIYTASQETSETFAEDIAQIKDELHDINSALHTVKKARGGQSTLKKTLQRLGNDAATKDILWAAHRLSERAKHTSDRVASTPPSTTLETAPSSEYSVVPDNELMAQADVHGVGFSFNGQPTADDTRKIESIIRLVDECSGDDSAQQSESVRVLRSRKSELSTYSFHYWGADAYRAGESSFPPDAISQQSAQSRTPIAIPLGSHTTFQQCTFNISNMQANDRSTVSDATVNLGVSVTGRDHPNIPSLLVHGSQGVEATQTGGLPPQDLVTNGMQSASERYSSAAKDSGSRDDIPAEATCSETHPSGVDSGKASPLMMGMENAKSHSMIVSGSAMVSSPTMNFNSPGATGATNTYIGAPFARCLPREPSTQSQSPEGLRVKCMEFSGESIVNNPTLNDQSQDASGAYNQEIPPSTGS